MNMQSFQGPLSDLWKIQSEDSIQRLTWQWWWWLVMLDAEEVEGGRQLMVLWSTKDTKHIDVNGMAWQSQGRPRQEGEACVLSGMVAAWWWDGEKMLEPLRLQDCRMAIVGSNNGSNEEENGCSGAVIPLTDEDLSMGLDAENNRFWLNMKNTEIEGPESFEVEMMPWHPAVSTLRSASKEYGKGMGYSINRLHGCKAKAMIDGNIHEGTAYLQRVKVQAPAVPWYWGMLHFSDGTYLDWFLPHVSMSMSSRTDRPWPLRHLAHFPLSQGGIWHDKERGRSERFNNCRVRLLPSSSSEGEGGHSPHAPLPCFEVELNNGRTRIRLRARAVSRAHFRFDQPTRGGMVSHLTYNEYPLKVEKLIVEDEKGRRELTNWDWVMGNGEHSWGLLH
jgi:hypothetical protein